MLLQFGEVAVRLSGNSEALQSHWSNVFDGWLRNAADAEADTESARHISLHLDVEPSLPPLPSGSPSFVDHENRVHVYEPAPGHFHLRFPSGAHVEVNTNAGEQHSVHGVINPRLLGSPQLTDVLYTSLSPLLRRRNYFLTHSAAVRSDSGNAVLFVGPSKSGKTTSSLTLFLDGWRYLSSDVLLLSRRADGIYAHPTPGEIHVRPPTLTLLPDLRQHALRDLGGTYTLTLTRQAWGKPAQVRAIFFPELANGDRARLTQLTQAEVLGRLLEESVDRWDSSYVQAHLEFLAALTEQATGQRLHLAPGIVDLPQLLAPLASNKANKEAR